MQNWPLYLFFSSYASIWPIRKRPLHSLCKLVSLWANLCQPSFCNNGGTSYASLNTHVNEQIFQQQFLKRSYHINFSKEVNISILHVQSFISNRSNSFYYNRYMNYKYKYSCIYKSFIKILKSGKYHIFMTQL